MTFNINDIRELLREDKIKWSGHILGRLQQRRIKIKDVIQCIENGDIIEYYLTNYLLPSCLILDHCNGSKGLLHAVCSLGEDNIWMITAYHPDESEWKDDLKTRRR